MSRFSELPLKEKVSGALLLLLLIYFVGGLIKVNIFDTSELRQNTRYTVATTTGMYLTLKGGRKISYEYSVDNKVYEGVWGHMDYLRHENGKYLIKFASTNPDIAERVCKEQVPKAFLNPPINGWKKMPYDAPCEYPGPLYIDKERLSK